MSSDDSSPARGSTVENTSLPESPGRVLLEHSIDELSDEAIAGVLLALVRDCSAIDQPVESARVVIGESVDLELPNKTLRVVFFCGAGGEVTWSEVQDSTYSPTGGFEWLIVSTRPFTKQVQREVRECVYRKRLHYIEISEGIFWMES